MINNVGMEFVECLQNVQILEFALWATFNVQTIHVLREGFQHVKQWQNADSRLCVQTRPAQIVWKTVQRL
jgi:hypothetical protein